MDTQLKVGSVISTLVKNKENEVRKVHGIVYCIIGNKCMAYVSEHDVLNVPMYIDQVTVHPDCSAQVIADTFDKSFWNDFDGSVLNIKKPSWFD